MQEHPDSRRTQARLACARCQAHTLVADDAADTTLICGVCGHEALGVRVPRPRAHHHDDTSAPAP